MCPAIVITVRIPEYRTFSRLFQGIVIWLCLSGVLRAFNPSEGRDPSGRERIITHRLSVAAAMKKRNIVWKTIGNKRFNLFWPRPVFPALNYLFVSYFPTCAFH